VTVSNYPALIMDCRIELGGCAFNILEGPIALDY
jgi:hypothetical protein